MSKIIDQLRANHDLAFWAAVFTFFSSMLTAGAVNHFDLHRTEEFIVAILVSFGAGVLVYARQRIYEAKLKGEKLDPKIPE